MMTNEFLLMFILMCKKSPDCDVDAVNWIESQAQITFESTEPLRIDRAKYEVLPIQGAGSNKVEGLAVFKLEN